MIISAQFIGWHRKSNHRTNPALKSGKNSNSREKSYEVKKHIDQMYRMKGNVMPVMQSPFQIMVGISFKYSNGNTDDQLVPLA